MRFLPFAAALAALAVPAAAAQAQSTAPGGSARAAAADPDAGLERLAAAGQRGERSNAKPDKRLRDVLRDDHYLRDAFASLGNR